MRRTAIAVAVAAVVVIVDQWTSTWAVHRLVHGPVHVIGPLTLDLGVNTGSAFGLGQGWAPLFAVLAVVAVVGLVIASRRARSDGLAVALGLVLGGAAGNLVDRLVRPYHGGVVDFIDLHYWPTFNVADAGITVGIVLLLVALLRAPADSPAASPGDGGHPDDGSPTGTRPQGADRTAVQKAGPEVPGRRPAGTDRPDAGEPGQRPGDHRPSGSAATPCAMEVGAGTEVGGSVAPPSGNLQA